MATLATPSPLPPTADNDGEAVDIEAIEQQKENIQPLAGGRSAAQLTSLFSGSRTPSSSVRRPFGTVVEVGEDGEGHAGGFNPKMLSKALKDGHAKYKGLIEALERAEAGEDDEKGEELMDDPLDVYVQYVKWTQESYPSGGTSSESRLVPLLEQATRRFVRDPRYSSDLRYLKLWNLYADRCPHSGARDIYRFLLSNEIGTSHAHLYEKFAAVLEEQGAIKEAKGIFDLGINRKATPTERLKKKRDAFVARMAVAPPPSTSAASNPTNELSASVKRRVGGLGTAGSAPQTKSNPNGGKMRIFVDGEPAEQQEVPGQPSTWQDVGTVKANRRENEVQATSWKGQTLPMGKALQTPGGSKIEIFHDEDALAAATPGKALFSDPSTTLTTPGNIFAPRSLRDPTDTELLQKDPFRNYAEAGIKLGDLTSVEQDAIASAALSASTASTTQRSVSLSNSQSKSKKALSSSQKSTQQASTSAAGTGAGTEKRERVACDLASIYPVDEPGAEYSWEEVRARRYIAQKQLEEGGKWTKSEWEVEARQTRRWHKIEADGKPLLHDPKTGEPLWDYLRPAWEAEQERIRQAENEGDADVTIPDEDEASPVRAGNGRHRAPSPTMNTKAALAEVDDMFAGTLNLDKYGQRDDDDGVGPDDCEDTFWEKSQSQPPRLFTQSQSQAMTQSQSQAPFVPFTQEGEDDEDEEEDDEGTAAAQEQSVTASESGTTGPLSRSSSGGSIVMASRPSSAFKPVRKPAVAADTDENGAQPGSIVRQPASASRLGRTPLGAKVGLPQRLFMVREDSHRAPASGQDDVFDGFDAIPDSQPDPAVIHEDFEESIHDQDAPTPATPMGDGYDMGRQRGNRFANLIDAMTPITERTCEFTSMTVGGDIRASTLLEEDEEYESETSAAAFDQAFVAEQSNSRFVDRSSSTFAGLETAVEASGAGNSTCKDGHLPPVTEDNESFERSHRSFNTSGATLHLPAGLEVTGNQSGFTVEMLVDKTSTVSLSSAVTSADASIDSSPASPLREQAPLAVPATPTTIEAGEPVCPFEAEIIECLIEGLEPALVDYPTYRDHSTSRAAKMESLQKRAKARARRSTGSQSRATTDDQSWEIELGRDAFFVREKLGEGAFGAVFRVAEVPDADVTVDEDDADGEGSKALKVESPPNPWEYVILTQLHARLPARIRQSVVAPHRFYAYEDESFLLMDYCDQGTLLHAVNKASTAGVSPAVAGANPGFDEHLAMFFTIELMRLVESLHAFGFIHGDLKIDNCLLRLQDVPGGAKAWDSAYDKDGERGWAYKGLKLIDYGRAIDVSVFPEGQRFLADWETDKFDCVEMRHGRPWTFQPDYHGIASIAYCMLFGSFMADSDAQKPPFRRYHQQELWTRLFDALLKPAEVPNTTELANVREGLEDWLTANCERGGKSLKGMLRKLELSSMA